MSRSRRKTPKTWLCTVRAGEMREWKRAQNRALRRLEADVDIGKGARYKRFSEIWASPSDGKINGFRVNHHWGITEKWYNAIIRK